MSVKLPFLYFKGKSSLDFNLIIKSKGSYNAPAQLVEQRAAQPRQPRHAGVTVRVLRGHIVAHLGWLLVSHPFIRVNHGVPVEHALHRFTPGDGRSASGDAAVRFVCHARDYTARLETAVNFALREVTPPGPFVRVSA